MKKNIENLDNNVKGNIISETIEKNIKHASCIFISGHKRPDFDSVGASAGLLSLVEQLGKKAYIIIDDSKGELDADIKKLITDFGVKLNIINLKEYEKLKDKDSILLLTDVNKAHRTYFNDRLDEFRTIIIVDHHDIKEGETIDKAIRLIYPDASSASELVARALLCKRGHDGKNKYKMNKDIATLLYSGIRLDTDGYKIEKNNITHAVTAKLFECGADKDYVGKLFRTDRGTYITVANLISNGTLLRQYSKEFTELGIAFSLNKEYPHFIYKPEELARSSDTQVAFRGTDAAFTLGYIKTGLVAISARSTSKAVDVGKIMEQMNGGGNATSAGTQILSNDIIGVEDKLIHIVEDYLSLQETPVVDFVPDLTDQPQQFKKVIKNRRKK